jgi:hypothetical protein
MRSKRPDLVCCRRGVCKLAEYLFALTSRGGATGQELLGEGQEGLRARWPGRSQRGNREEVPLDREPLPPNPKALQER